MSRIIRPLLFALAVLALLAIGRARADGDSHASRPELQTPAPTGRIVVKLAPDATDADRDRIAAIAAAPMERRIDAASLQAVAAKSRRPAPALTELTRYRHFDRPDLTRDGLLRLVRRLADDPAAAAAFLEPRAVPAALGFDAFTGATPARAGEPEPPLPTDDFTALQGYLGQAPDGIGAYAMRTQAGARGATVKIVDVEGAWLWEHEDLPTPFLDLGLHVDDLSWRNHGTAVIGELRGIENGYGIDGIVPDSQVGNSSIGDQSVAGALVAAAAHLDPGDLVLIELHAPGPNANGSGQYGYVPMEFWQDNFDAIRALTDLGIIVVEAAGNGQQDLDDPVYLDLFDRDFRDSGAIMVGATDGSALWPAWFSNHGQRVDLSGWGLTVTTCGYGDLQGGDEIEWYTQQFSGTSSASPIVTGAVAALQGMIEAEYGFSADAGLAREILRQTGTAINGPPLVGPRPDLEAAWALAAQGASLLVGTVTDADSGAPVAGAEVTLEPDGPTIVTGADGTYRLGLLPGDHLVAVRSYFHFSSIEWVTVTSGIDQRDVALTPLPLEIVAGTVRDQAEDPVAGATVALLDDPVPPVATGVDGGFAFDPVPEGRAHRIMAGGVPGMGGAYWEPIVDVPLAMLRDLDLDLGLPPVDYDFESGEQGFVPAGLLWQRGRPADTGMGPGQAFDGQWCWGIGLDGAGYPDEGFGMLWSPTYMTGDFEGDRLYLSFHYWSGTEPGFDGVNVVLDPAGAYEVVEPVDGYTDLALSGLGYRPGWSGHSDGWRTAVFDLTSRLEAASWNFALIFGSDGAVTDEGFLIDGIALEAVDVVTAAPDGSAPDAATPGLAAWPNPFNPRVNLAWELAAPGRLDLAIHDLRGRLVRQLMAGAEVAARGRVIWDGTDQAGRPLPSGIYLVTVRVAGGDAVTGRVTLAR